MLYSESWMDSRTENDLEGLEGHWGGSPMITSDSYRQILPEETTTATATFAESISTEHKSGKSNTVFVTGEKSSCAHRFRSTFRRTALS